MRFYGYKKRNFGIVFLSLVILVCIIFGSVHTMKVVTSLAKTVAIQKTTEIMNTCALKHINEASDLYSAMIVKEKKDSGSVSSVDTDIAKINLLQTEIAEIITRELKNKKQIAFKVSLANIMGYPLVTDKGIGISVRFAPISVVTAKFKESFISAGINQTMLSVDLEICADVQIGSYPVAFSEKITHTIPVAKMVIVGDTPAGFYSGKLNRQ